MTDPMLRADCTRCAALCCVALAFDRSDLFAFDKAAGEPCSHLDSCGRCRIHEIRAQRGFQGCIDYDCLGAGQRVTQDLFGGRDWRNERALLRPMLRAFAVVRRAHEMLSLLGEAARLPLSPDDRAHCHTLQAMAANLDASVDTAETETRAFLRSLRRYFQS